jgi:hypothetical protein
MLPISVADQIISTSKTAQSFVRAFSRLTILDRDDIN